MVVFKVNIRWKSNKFSNVSVDTDEDFDVLCTQLYTLTGVPNENQKIIIKGKTLKKEDWKENLNKDNMDILLLGNITEIKSSNNETEIKNSTKTSTVSTRLNDENNSESLPKGFINLGNTCYVNAILQLIFSIKEIKDFLFNSSNEPNKNLTTFDLFNLLKNIYIMQYKSKDTSFSLNMFFEKLIVMEPRFGERNSGGELLHQDANEFLTKLLEMIKPHLTSINGNLIEKLFEIQLTEYTECISNKSENYTKSLYENSLICYINQDVRYLLDGLKTKMSEKITKNSSLLDINTEFQKTTYLENLPPYLFIQMNRFFYKEKEKINAKILKDVKFPINLDVYDLCSKDLQSKISLSRQSHLSEPLDQMKINNTVGFYELKGIITHQGRLSTSGHYIAWIKNDSNTNSSSNWNKFDDNIVSLVGESEIMKLSGGGEWHSAYTLLYSICQII